MYKNKEKMLVSILLWSVVGVIGFTGVFIFLGVFFDTLGSTEASVGAGFLFCAFVCGAMVWLYLKTFANLMVMNRISDLLALDEDGVVPLQELADEMKTPKMKLLRHMDKGMRKGFLVNMNYNASDGVIYLSDRARRKEAILFKGVPEDKPFVGVHCEGCGASLKIRVRTRGTCPFCGREIIQG